MRCGHCGFESPAGMRFCGGCGRPLEVAAPAQRRHITVMFCDMVGSTPLVAALDPEDWREILKAYQHACARAIDRFDGWTAQWAGDGLLAYFGYPRAYEDAAQRAAHAGLGILEEVAKVSAEYGVPLQVRVGLHSGEVVAGEMGTGGATDQFGIVGETTHIAARVESNAAAGTVVMTDATRNLIDGYFELEPLGAHPLKGVPEPVPLFRVAKATGAAGRLETAPLQPMVGRENELQTLLNAWEHVQSGEGLIAHLPGEAGIGKSRLVRALTERLGGVTTQVWQCSSMHGSTTLHPIVRYLEDRPLKEELRYAGISEAVAMPLLADLLSLPGPRSALPPRDHRTALLHVLEALLVTNAKHPLLLIIEDLHWADPTTVELLGRIAAILKEVPVLCVATFRREFEPPWPANVTVELQRLGANDVKAMLGDREIDANWVEAASDGVPLFVEELLKLPPIDRNDSTTTAIPPTLQGLLTHRLEQLPHLGEVIDAAAVLGREFEPAHLQPLTTIEVGPALAQLAAADVIRKTDGRFEFTHALLQDAAYARILRRRRQGIHARVAQVLADDQREPEVIAHHWSRAKRPQEAVPFWHAAGARALNQAAFLEAADHFRRGLKALDALEGPPTEERAEFLTHLAAALQAGLGYAAPGVEHAYAQARAASSSSNRRDSVIRGQWMFYLLRAEYDTALELAGEMTDHPAEEHLYRGLAHTYLGHLDLAREHLQCAYDRYVTPQDRDQIYEAQGDTGAGALAYLSLVLWNLGHAEESMQRSDLSLALAEQVGGPVTKAQAYGMRAFLHFSRVEPAEIVHWVERTRAHSVDHNIGYWRTISGLLGGWLIGRGHSLEAGIHELRASLDAYKASGSRLGLPHFYLLGADLELAAGHHSAALDSLKAGEEHIAATGERDAECELHRFKSRVLLATGEHDRAIEACERAVEVAHEQNAKLLELRALTQLVEYEPSGAERLAELCDWFTTDLPDVQRARALIGAPAR